MLADYSKALEIDPEFAEALFNRGNCRVKLRDFKRAISDYTEALNMEQAAADYKHALKIDSNLGKVYPDLRRLPALR